MYGKVCLIHLFSSLAKITLVVLWISFIDIQGADDKLGQVSRRSLTDVTLCE